MTTARIRWKSLSLDERAVLIAVLQELGRTSRAVRPKDVAQRTSLSPAALAQALATLANRDHIDIHYTTKGRILTLPYAQV